MKLLSDKYFPKYEKKLGNKIMRDFSKIEIDDDENNFEYYIESSAVYSSNIEGNSIDLNSFMNSKLQKKKFKSKEYDEITDLIDAYNFAKKKKLIEKNFLESHKRITERILIESKQGKYREEKVGVFDTKGLVYLAVEPEYVENEMEKLFTDIKELLSDEELSINKIFYFSSLIHLKFAHIHPFMDGNGRAARLLEKWFLSAKLGENAWKIKSEKYYKENLTEYYKNLNLGENYYVLNYDKLFPFLEMLPKAIV